MKKDEIENIQKAKQIKDEFTKANFYLLEIKKLKEKERILTNIIAENTHMIRSSKKNYSNNGFSTKKIVF